MEAIMLKTDVWQILEQDAQQESRSVTDLVNEAIEQYLYKRQLAKIDREIAGYERLYPELQAKYLGQWVAVHNQKLIDCDNDRAALYHRVRAIYNQTPVLIRQVTEAANEDLWIRTPSYGKRV